MTNMAFGKTADGELVKLTDLHTRDEYEKAFRYMWNWLANETLRQKRKVPKSSFFKKHNVPQCLIPDSECYMCEYVLCEYGRDCGHCPVKWNQGACLQGKSEFRQLLSETDYKKASELCRIIANLPLKED